MSAAKLLEKRGAKVKKLASAEQTAVKAAQKTAHAKTKKPRGAKGPAIWRLRDGRRRATQMSYSDLLTAESAIGRTLFGPVPAGRQREFFTAQKNVWLWYESWTDAAGAFHDMTIRYEVRPAGVYKLPSGGVYTRIEGAELDNFANAVRSYYGLVKARLYS